MTDFIFLGSQITVGDDYSHEIKRDLLFERKAMTNIDSILKSRKKNKKQKYHFAEKGSYSESHVFFSV